MIACWKGIIEEIHFGGSIMPSVIIEKLDLEKPSFRPSKWPRKLKLLKIVNCQNCQKTVLSQLEKVGGHRYPPGSILYVDDIFLITRSPRDIENQLRILKDFFSNMSMIVNPIRSLMIPLYMTTTTWMK
jgi:hypothetical protein